MATETLTFHCPHCNIRLTVPAKFAGVKGPCPSCRLGITAPVPEAGPSPFEASEPSVAPPPLSPPEPEPETETETETAVAPASAELPSASVPPVPGIEEVSGSPEGPKIRPEPRLAKERPLVGPIQARHSTADERMKRSEPVSSTRSRRSGRLMQALVPAIFCAAATTLSYLLLYFYLPGGPGKRMREATAPLAAPPPPAAIVEAPPSRPAEPVEEAEAPEAAALTAPAPAEHDGPSPAVIAGELLDAFLRAKDARTRYGMVEPDTGIPELEALPLMNGPLWEVERISPELPQHHPEEQMTDYPYRVTFFVPNRKSVDFSMLVRQRGTQSPKVFLPAFLDLAGGRLYGFTRQPNTLDPATFHAVIEPVPGCHEQGIPNSDRKFTLKLLSSSIGKETSRAYVSTGSRFKKMVEDPASSLRWGVRIRATVTLQWNHKEDPEKPYLELMDINSLGWSP